MEYVRFLQEKSNRNSRLIIPPEVRRALGKEMIIIKGPGKSLRLYPLNEWQKLVEGQKNKRTQKNLAYYAKGVMPDRQGRILIPVEFQEYASLGKEVVITAEPNKDFVEIYSRGKVKH